MKFVTEKHTDVNVFKLRNPEVGDLLDERINTFFGLVVWVDNERSLVGLAKRCDWIVEENNDTFTLVGIRKITILSKDAYFKATTFNGIPTVYARRKVSNTKELFDLSILDAALSVYENENSAWSESLEETG